MKHAASPARGDAIFHELVTSVDELLSRISDIDSPDIPKIRAKVQIAVSAAKSAWQDTADFASKQMTNSMHWPGERLRESPWRAVGIAAAIGIGMGALLTRQRDH